MAYVLSSGPARSRSVGADEARELARRLDLIEDRPDEVLTWADVVRLARAAWRRLVPAPGSSSKG